MAKLTSLKTHIFAFTGQPQDNSLVMSYTIVPTIWKKNISPQPIQVLKTGSPISGSLVLNISGSGGIWKSASTPIISVLNLNITETDVICGFGVTDFSIVSGTKTAGIFLSSAFQNSLTGLPENIKTYKTNTQVWGAQGSGDSVFTEMVGIEAKFINPTKTVGFDRDFTDFKLAANFAEHDVALHDSGVQSIFLPEDLQFFEIDWRIKDSSSGHKTFEDTIIGNNPMNVNFEDLSNGTNETYKWTKRDGVLGNDIIFSHKAEPSHVFDGRNPDKAATPEEIQNEAIGVSSND